MDNCITDEEILPDFLSHYYEAMHGPFLNLSDLSVEKAEQILTQLRQQKQFFASKRPADYLKLRYALENQVRAKFIDKGGRPVRQRPHYMILGMCSWLKKWYPNGCELRIPLAHFDPTLVSFTYGDTFPAMRFEDGRPYRGQVYTMHELQELVQRYGLPQRCNPGGESGPDRYIEAQIWSDEPLSSYVN